MKLKQRLALCWRILRAEPGNLMAHADRELPLDGTSDEMQFDMNRCLRELIFVFSTQGHSGFSAGYATAVLEKLLRFEPLGPLTGEESEWCAFENDGEGGAWAQNKRCGRVFRRGDGTAYDMDGRVFRDPDGYRYTSNNSRVDVVFPYTPKTEYIDVDAEGKPT